MINHVPCKASPLVETYKQALDKGIAYTTDAYGHTYDLAELVQTLEEPCPVCKVLGELGNDNS